MTMPADQREALILDFARDPIVAHQTLFASPSSRPNAGIP